MVVFYPVAVGYEDDGVAQSALNVEVQGDTVVRENGTAVPRKLHTSGLFAQGELHLCCHVNVGVRVGDLKYRFDRWNGPRVWESFSEFGKLWGLVPDRFHPGFRPT